MAIRRAPLNLLSFPQSWDGAGKLTVRFVAMPGVDPDTRLSSELPSFADLNLQLEARFVAGLEALPRAADVVLAVGSDGPSTALALDLDYIDKPAAFAAVGAALGVERRQVGAVAPAPRRVLKPATQSYRAAIGNRQVSPFLIDPERAGCDLHKSIDAMPPEPKRPRPRLRWGEAMALALRQPRLARALGLIGEAQVPIPPKLLEKGGWIFLAPWPSGTSLDAVVSLQAARIPPLAGAQSLYAAVLFPVDQDDFPADDLYAEAVRYEAGFARIVHAALETSDRIAREGEPHFDSVRLAWDDGQIAEWLNRQTRADAGAPMGTIGYRVDVREADGDGSWHSLQRVETVAPIAVGSLNLGSWTDDELSVAVTPVRRGTPGSALWLPSYFARWTGRSLVVNDGDLVALHRAAAAHPAAAIDCAESFGGGALRFLGRDEPLRGVADDTVALRYGRSYEFRVRLADLSHGGPGPEASLPASIAEGAIARVAFRRSRPPGPVRVIRAESAEPEPASLTFKLRRPLLGLPEIRYASTSDPLPSLIAQLGDKDSEGSGLPDPHVTHLRIRVEAGGPVGDRDWLLLYEYSIPFPDDSIAFSLRSVGRLAELADEIAAHALVLPTRRPLRLAFAGEAHESSLFSDAQAMEGDEVVCLEHFRFGAEPPLLDPDRPEVETLRAWLFRPPDEGEQAPSPLVRLADDLRLTATGGGLACRPPLRTILAASESFAAAPSPDATAIDIGGDATLFGRWIVALDLLLARDWCWRGLPEIAVERRVGDAGIWRRIGSISLPPRIPAALAPVDSNALHDMRQSIRMVLIDAVEPDAGHPQFPAELTLGYRLVAVSGGAATAAFDIRLPVATPPRQRPALASAGIAQSPYIPSDDYSTTLQRDRRVWLEFEEAPLDPGDSVFARILAHGPDPILVDLGTIPDERVETAFRPDSGFVRTIRPGQPRDADGRSAMPIRLERGADARHWLLPLPDGLDADAPELFGFYTYEIRIGHDDQRWCTPHGRWSPPLRVAGVQHPPPPLRCHCVRTRGAMAEHLVIRAPYAFPVHEGRGLLGRVEPTTLWAQLFARIRRAHDGVWSNLLIGRYPLQPAEKSRASAGPRWGEQTIAINQIEAALKRMALPPDTPLTVLAVEFVGAVVEANPLGAGLGAARILRISPLIPVPATC